MRSRVGCSRCDRPAADGGEGADLILHGGPILTMEGDQPSYVEAVVIDDGKIQEDEPPQELFTNPKHPRLKAFLSKML